MTTKIILEIKDGGFSVQRKELEAGETVVAMSFKNKGGGAYGANIATIGTCNKETVINYATATASAIARMTEGHPAAPLYWRLFEETLHACMAKNAEKEADRCEEQLKEDLLKMGINQEAIDTLLDTVRKAAEREAKNESRK